MERLLNSNWNIRSKISLLIVFFGLITLILGTSYAVLKGNIESENNQIIKTGNVTMKINEKYENMSTKIKIMSDKEGLLQRKTYDFSIENIGSVAANYKLKLISEAKEEKVLPLKYIKVALEKNNKVLGPIFLEELNGLIDEDMINENEIINYKLRIWLDETKINEIETMEGYSTFLKLKAEAKQF